MEALDFERLDRLADELKDVFRSATPYPHVVIDDFLPADVARALSREYAELGAESWKHYYHYNERKLAITDLERMPPTARRVVEALQSDRAVEWMIRLSGIEGLVSDPSLEGAGMHLVQRGGFLNVHTDFLAHTKRRSWSRHINLLIYLNEGWKEEWKGDLELWDHDLTRCVRSVPPLFNRCVVFNTLEKSYHGHPEKLECPEGESRKSLLLYYYRDEGQPLDLSSTDYQALPGDSLARRFLIAADRTLLRLYTFVKGRTKVSDRLMDRILRRF